MGVAVIPAGAIIAGILLAQRLGGGGKEPPEGEPGVLGVFVWLVFLPLGLASLAQVLGGHWGFLPVVFVCVVLLFPWLLARAVLIPLGRVREAYLVVWASDGLFRLDRQGGAALAGAFALLRRARHEPALEAWVLGRMERQRPRLRGAGAVALGLLSASRGDLDEARQLLTEASRFAPKVLPSVAARLARGWLLADQAARGSWEALAAREPRWGEGLEGFFAAASRRLLGHPEAPSTTRLALAWLEAGAPFGALGLLQRAWVLGARASAPEEARAPLARAPDESLEEALALHAALLRAEPGAITGEAVARVAGAWDTALGLPAVRERSLRRALALRTSGSEALGRVREEAAASLAELCRRGGVALKALDGRGATAEGIARTLREALLTELELAAEAIQARVDEKRALPRTDEWRDFVRFLARYDQAVEAGGEALRRLAYGQTHRAVCNLAVWLFNDRKEWAVGHVIFEWLRVEAERLGDTRLLELHTKNAACGT